MVGGTKIVYFLINSIVIITLIILLFSLEITTNVTLLLQLFLTLYLRTCLVAMTDQRRGEATIRLPRWKKYLLFLFLQNLFAKRTILFQKSVMIITIIAIGVMLSFPFIVIYRVVMISYAILICMLLIIFKQSWR